MSLRARLESWRERFDGWLNPILVKELRQAVRGRFVFAALSVALVGQLVTVSGFMIGGMIDVRALTDVPTGGRLFFALYFVLFMATAVLIPLYSGIRVAVERSDTNVDLLFITTIRPRTIVIGKVMTIFALTALLFFASMPFLFFSYVLRGIDFITIFFVLLIAFAVVCSAAIAGLFIGCIPASRPFKFLLGVAFLVALSTVFIAVMRILENVVRASTMTMFADKDFWMLVSLLAVLCIAVNAIFLVLTTALITPPTANRALPIRATLSVMWVVTLMAGFWITKKVLAVELLQFWAVAQLALGTLVLLSAIGEREEWGRRITRTIPRDGPRRFLAFLFYSGSGGGILWTLFFYVATVLAYEIGARNLRAPLRHTRFTLVLLEGILCAIGYTMLALYLRRRALRRVQPRHTWAVAFILLFIGVVIPPLMVLVQSGDSAALPKNFHLANLLNPFDFVSSVRPFGQLRVIVQGSFAMFAFAANAVWLSLQWGRFRRLEVDGAGPVEARPAFVLEETSAP